MSLDDSTPQTYSVRLIAKTAYAEPKKEEPAMVALTEAGIIDKIG